MTPTKSVKTLLKGVEPVEILLSALTGKMPQFKFSEVNDDGYLSMIIGHHDRARVTIELTDDGWEVSVVSPSADRSKDILHQIQATLDPPA